MKKKILSLGAVLVALVTPMTGQRPKTNVSAATTSSQANSNIYFTFNGQKLANNATVPLSKGINASAGETVNSILEKAKKVVSLSSSQAEIITDAGEVSRELLNQDVKIQGNSQNQALNTIEKVPTKGFYITLTAKYQNETVNVKVPFGNYYTVANDEPAVNVEYKQNATTVKQSANGQIFQVKPNSKFNPLEFTNSNGEKVSFSADQSSSNSKQAKLTAVSNSVDTSKAGTYYTVKLSAINDQNKSKTISYQVYVTPTTAIRFNSEHLVYGYRFSDNYSRLVSMDKVNYGQKIYVGNQTYTCSNNYQHTPISYTKFSLKSQKDANSASNNNWIPTSELMTGGSQVKGVTKMVMHTATVYDQGGSTKVRKIKAFTKLTFDSKTVMIKGTKYYRVVDQPDYIKATNIDGTKRKLKKNAYIYSSSTKRTSHNGVWKLSKGQTITTYGGSYKFKNGKRYYRIGGPAKQYVRTSNF